MNLNGDDRESYLSGVFEGYFDEYVEDLSCFCANLAGDLADLASCFRKLIDSFGFLDKQVLSGLISNM